MVKFSTIITTYNRLPLLKRAIASVLAQTVPCEIIVVDDCSMDETREYLANLGRKVNLYRNQSNSGHSVSVNNGVAIAQGDWIKLLDDDDYLSPNCLEVMMQAIAQYPEAVICSSRAAQVNLEGQEIKRTQKYGKDKLIFVPQEDIHYLMLLENLPFGTPVQVAFRKDAFLKSGGWDANLDLGDDIDSWVRIAQHGDAILINQCLCYRTIWPGGYNQKFSFQERLAANIIIKEKIYSLVSEKYKDNMPSMSDIKKYLKLHWGLVAIKNWHILTFLKISYPSLLSLNAWKILLNALNRILSGHKP